jgi:GNAT superfamily N-acetyltransferase
MSDQGSIDPTISGTPFTVEEHLVGGLRYDERLTVEPGRGSCRTCSLWAPGAADPVSTLRIRSLRQRFGAVIVAAEGVGGVQTPHEHRGRGYGTRLVEHAIAGARERVATMFLFGIQKMYSKLGFATCLADTTLSMQVRNAEAAEASPGDERSSFVPDDLPALVRLFNEEHRVRPWTAVRGEYPFVRLTASHPWRPAPDVIVIRREGTPRAYAVVSGTTYGRPLREMAVVEAAAVDASAARSLLAAVARTCWEWRIGSFTLEEPADGSVGTEARRLGCEVRQTWVPDGEGMGLILDRAKLIAALEGELARRERCAETGQPINAADGLSLSGSAPMGTFEALLAADLVPDDGWLIQLLLGFRSWHEAEHAGLETPAEHRRTLLRWFPGTAPYLPAGHAHRLDRY